MKKTVSLTTLALVLSAGSALAADLPSRKAEPMLPPPPPPMWTGFYAGLNAGYGFGVSNGVYSSASGIDQFYNSYTTGPWGWVTSNRWTAGRGGLLAGNSGNGSLSQSGFVGGAQVGYNYQWGQKIVVGVEVDVQGSSIRGNGSFAGAGSDTFTMGTGAWPANHHTTRTTVGSGSVQAGLDWFGTVRGRLGYLVTPTLLVYGTGGLTYGGAWANTGYFAQSNFAATGMLRTPYGQTGLGDGRASQTLVGWNAGGGLEWMFMPSWSLKAEAFYYDLGNMNVTGASFAPASGVCNGMCGMAQQFIPDAQALAHITSVRYNGIIARAGVNYQFNWGSAPVVASY